MWEGDVSLHNKWLPFANCMAASQELNVLPLNWAEQARQRERRYPFHLPPPWHLVHLSCGPVVVTGEWLRFVPDQKILGSRWVHSSHRWSPGDQRCQVHLVSAWGSPVTCLCRIGLKTLRGSASTGTGSQWQRLLARLYFSISLK